MQICFSFMLRVSAQANASSQLCHYVRSEKNHKRDLLKNVHLSRVFNNGEA